MKRTYSAIVPGMFYAVTIHADSKLMAKREFKRRFCLNRFPREGKVWLAYE